MRRTLLAIICSLLGAVVVIGTAPPVAARTGTVSGTWTSIDNDGSSQELIVRGSGQGKYAMFLVDDSATNACDGNPAMFVGTSVPDGNTLLMTGSLTCLPGGNVVRHRITIEFEYSPGTDTLTDETGVTWYRS